VFRLSISEEGIKAILANPNVFPKSETLVYKKSPNFVRALALIIKD
jgi:hypothetical protein